MQVVPHLRLFPNTRSDPHKKPAYPKYASLALDEEITFFGGITSGIQNIRNRLKRHIRHRISQLKDLFNCACFFLIQCKGLASSLRLVAYGCLDACIAARRTLVLRPLESLDAIKDLRRGDDHIGSYNDIR